MDRKKFVLSENFISKYKRKKPPFGFNGLGELVYMRTYSRIKENGKNERWWETVQRVVEGTYTMQMNWIESHQLGWNPWQAQKSAQDMYERIFTMKFSDNLNLCSPILKLTPYVYICIPIICMIYIVEYYRIYIIF